MAREWNAAAYHKVSAPQVNWGRKVLSRLEVRGDERAIDAGCGTGRLTAELVERVPDGRVVGLDRSRNMLDEARAHLEPRFGARVAFVQAHLPDLPFREWADLVFSTATFHWVLDHPALFAGLFGALRPGGRLFAQCGGGPNLDRAHALAETVMRRPPFAPHFASWTGVWEFASDTVTADRLRAAGFTGIAVGLEPAPTVFPDEAAYREFVTTVIYHPHLSRLPDASLRQRFLDEVTALAAATDPPFELDYWRLNIDARRPKAR
ncbi:MAG: methyltransferase domain-containing protein [Acidobacteriota bacterium]